MKQLPMTQTSVKVFLWINTSDDDLKTDLIVYCTNAAIQDGASYKMLMLVVFAILFLYLVLIVVYLSAGDDKSGAVYQACGFCYANKQQKGINIRQTINNYSREIIRV